MIPAQTGKHFVAPVGIKERQMKSERTDKRNLIKSSTNEKKAERLEKESDIKCAVLDDKWGDIAFFTQPAAPASRFGRQRARLYRRYNKGLEVHAEAQELKEHAEWIEKVGVRVKGDAEEKDSKNGKSETKYLPLAQRCMTGFLVMVKLSK